MAGDAKNFETMEDASVEAVIAGALKSAKDFLGEKSAQKVSEAAFKKVLAAAPSVLHASKNVGNLTKSLNAFFNAATTFEKGVDKDVNGGDSKAARKGAAAVKVCQKAAKEGMKVVTQIVNVTRSHSMAILKKGLSHSKAPAVKESTSLLFAE